MEFGNVYVDWITENNNGFEDVSIVSMVRDYGHFWGTHVVNGWVKEVFCAKKIMSPLAQFAGSPTVGKEMDVSLESSVKLGLAFE